MHEYIGSVTIFGNIQHTKQKTKNKKQKTKTKQKTKATGSKRENNVQSVQQAIECSFGCKAQDLQSTQASCRQSLAVLQGGMD